MPAVVEQSTQGASQVVTTGTAVVSRSPGATWSAEEIVEVRDGRVIVVNGETGIFGSGEDLVAALKDFEQALREHFDVLVRQEKLGPDLARQLKYLRYRLEL